MGGEKSGTPMETRKGTSNLAGSYEQAIGGDPRQLMEFLQPFQRMGSQSFSSMYGYNPQDIGGILESLLADPADQTSGLFASMEPFEEAETNRQVSGMRNMFGTAGARFSKNLGTSEGNLRGELSNQFAKTRQEGLLGANAQRGNVLAQLMQAITGQQAANMAPLQLANQFLMPGAPQFQEGLLPGLLGAAGSIYAAKSVGG